MTSAPPPKPVRLAVVVSHPIQYYAPWFKHLAAQSEPKLKVFYLWDFGVEARFDPGFGQTLQWDIPLLEGYEHVFIPNRSKDPGTHHFRGLDNPGLVPALEAWKPDAILLFGYTYLSHLRVILSSRLRGIPLLLRGDSHDLARPRGMKEALKRRVRSVLFKRFAAFLAVGKANADYYRHSGVPEDRIHFVPHAVDNDRFQAAAPKAMEEARAWRRELGIAEDALVVLFAGKFEDKKRPMDLLEAFLQVRAGFLDGRQSAPVLLFVGSGEWEARLRERAGSQPGKDVFFAPFQNQREMPKVYAAADLLVLPSVGSGETWGLAVNEAMSLGCPALVSSHVGCGPDLVDHGETGWSFEAGDTPALSATLAMALSMEPKERRDMGLAAKAKVQEYSFNLATRGLLKAISALSAHQVRVGHGSGA